MTKRPQRQIRRNSSTPPTTSSDAPTPDVMEERVLAFAEDLGRLAATVQAKAAGWMDGDALKHELARVRDGAADLLRQLAADAPPVAQTAPAATAFAPHTGRSGGVVGAPGKRHRPLMPSDPDARHARSQAAKMREAKTMVKTHRRRGRG
jgi:hypothetical protein